MSTGRHQDRAVGLLGVIEGKSAVQLEEVVPTASRSIDAIMQIEEPDEAC